MMRLAYSLGPILLGVGLSFLSSYMKAYVAARRMELEYDGLVYRTKPSVSTSATLDFLHDMSFLVGALAPILLLGGGVMAFVVLLCPWVIQEVDKNEASRDRGGV